MASGFNLQDALNAGTIAAQYDAARIDMADCLMDTASISTAGTVLPVHQLQADAICPAEQALVDTWIPAHEHDSGADVSMPPHNVSGQPAASVAGQGEFQPGPSKEAVLGSWLPAQEEYTAAGSSMQLPNVSLQHAARQGYAQPAEGLASNRPYAATNERAYQQLSGTCISQLVADVPSTEAPEHPLEQGQTSLEFCDDMEELFGVVYKDLTPLVHQQQSSGGPWLQSPAPFSMLPSTHPTTTSHRHSPPSGSSGASPGGLGAACWLDSMPMQPQTDRLPALLTPGCFPYVQAVDSAAAVAEDSPDSARSATMALGFFSRQALGAQGPNQAAVCAHDAAPWPLQSQVPNSSGVSHAGLQHAAFVEPGRQPWVQSQSDAQMLDSNAALLPSVGGDLPSASGTRQKRKASEETVGLDDLGSAVLEGMLRDLPTAPAVFGGNWGGSGGSGGSAAHAAAQHLQLGGMTQVQALAQQLLPALAAVETKQPRKRQKTGPTPSQVQFQAGPRLQPHPYPPSPAHPQASFPGKTRPQPYARPCPRPQRRPRRKTQPRLQAQPQVAAPPSNLAAAPATAPATAPAATPAAAPTQESGYQFGQVVWAKSRGCPWWPATVQQPTAEQAQVTNMSEGKVYVVYHGTGKEIDAVSGAQIRRWHTLQPSNKDKKGKLSKALQSAEQAIADGAVV